MPEIDADVVTRASQGDIQAFESIFKAYAAFIYNVALGVLRDRQDAEEVVQEVFVAVHRSLKHFRFQSSLKTWIYRITVNMAINSAKKRAQTRNRTIEYDDALDSRGSECPLSAEEQKEHFSVMVDQALNSLTPEQRMCIVLREVEGLSYEEMAETLKINVNAVRSRLKRARERLIEIGKKVDRHEL